MRRPNNNVAPRRHQISTGVWSYRLIDGRKCGTKASPCFEIAGMAQGGIGATRFQGRSQSVGTAAWQSVRPCPGTEGPGYSLKRWREGWKCQVLPPGKSQRRIAPSRHSKVFGDCEERLFSNWRSGNQQCERLQISTYYAAPDPGLLHARFRDKVLRRCQSHSSGTNRS